MCGIIGIVGKEPAADRLVDSLRRLEYRGYDSAGIATTVNGVLDRRRAPGKLKNLEGVLNAEPLKGFTGIGHTRWATHGAPTTENAHPHIVGRAAVVHNGIIENFAELKAELIAQGRTFTSQTDTEVVAHLMDRALGDGLSPLDAFKQVLGRITGAYALCVMVSGEKPSILGSRLGPPLVVGHGNGEMYLGSDAIAVGPFTNRVTYLEEGDFVLIDHDGATIYDHAGRLVSRQIHTVAASAAMVEKGNYRHFMLKEIHEQPDACQHTLSTYLDPVAMKAKAPGVDFSTVSRLQIVACGTAYLAGMTAKYMFEKIAGLPVDVEIASEFRYRDPALSVGTMAIAVSQSGETADTLAALRWCKQQGLKTAALVNAHQSSMAREADILWPTHAGAEIGVASTKAYTSQVCALLALSIAAAAQRGRIDAAEEARLVHLLTEVPRLIGESIMLDERIKALAFELSKARDVLYLGRGPLYPLALEGALKLKEISYIHAEGYAAGELKHGPIALVDEATPVIVIAPTDPMFDKTVSNMQEVAARGAPIIMVTDEAGAAHAPLLADVIIGPACDPFIAPLVYAAPMQLLAYHVAVHKGTDVDQPRNLAKSVTVE
ncbi:MAG: glutamine--fructose-6-phosphate transaminase (isomerizing) [Pseudomonadota bacterium]|nr:glutamine--fructose-6-phosphate transaminase (isomerizing) [Pseudomonadota bacterium]